MSTVGLKPADVSYFYIYKDHLFFDYIAKVNDRFVNFCKVTDENQSRYSVLTKLDKWLDLNPFYGFERPIIKHLDVDNQQWFYENMPFYQDLGKFTYNDCVLFDKLMQEFNEHILPFKNQLTDNEKQCYNKVIFDYTPVDMRNKDSDILFEYGDSYRCFDCNRITRHNNTLLFTGYQGFLFYNQDFNIGIILLMSMLFDTYKEKEQKLKSLDLVTIDKLHYLIKTQEQRVRMYPDQFYRSIEEFKKNLEDVKDILCKQLQSQDQLDLLEKN